MRTAGLNSDAKRGRGEQKKSATEPTWSATNTRLSAKSLSSSAGQGSTGVIIEHDGGLVTVIIPGVDPLTCPDKSAPSRRGADLRLKTLTVIGTVSAQGLGRHPLSLRRARAALRQAQGAERS